MSPLPDHSVCLEKELLAQCARTEVEPENANRIRDYAAGPLDWEYVVSRAQENSIAALVERSLRRASPDLVPEAEAARLEAMTRANALRCLAFSAELIRVMDALESRGIHAIPYKGPVIAVQAYGDVAARQFEDLDVILGQNDIEVADETIRGLGYAARFPVLHSGDSAKRVIPGEYNYFHSARGIILELHTELTLRHFPVRPNLDTFLERGVSVDLGGRKVRTFCPEDALVMLCVHGAKDFWDKLIWIADVAELLRSFPVLDWGLVRGTTEQLLVQRMLHLGLVLATEILEARIPEEVGGDVKSDSGALDVAREIAARVLSRETRGWTASGRFQYRRRMMSGTAAGWCYAMRLTLSPAEEDWQGKRLPAGLTPLYAALRPFRLLRRYGLSGK